VIEGVGHDVFEARPKEVAAVITEAARNAENYAARAQK
jgi:hypothetical protein